MQTVGTGFVTPDPSYLLNNINSLGNNAEYMMVTSAQSSKPYYFGTSKSPYGMIIDAVEQAPSISLSPTYGQGGSTVTLSGNGFAASSKITVTFNGVSLLTTLSTVTTTASGSIPSGATFSVPTIADGTYTVTATDAHTPAANTASSTFIVDTVAPSVSITAPTSSQYFKISSVGASGTASDAGSGIVSVQVKVDSGSYVAATGTTSWSYSSFTGISDGSHTITALATDNAGNTKTATVTFTVDTVAPTSSVNTLGTYQTSASFAVSYSSNDAASGVANVHISGLKPQERAHTKT